MNLRIGLIVLACVFSTASQAKEKKIQFPDNSKVPPQSIPAPNLKEMGFLTEEQISQIAETAEKDGRRKPSGSAAVATEDMLSPEFVVFRDKLVGNSKKKINGVRTGVDFYNLIKEYDDKYDSLPENATDLKFMVARMAAWLPMRGVIWRMTPMVHKVLVPQQMILTTLRNFAEQVMINEPNSHVQAQMMYLSMPTPDIAAESNRFTVESDFMSYLAKEVYPSLLKSWVRLEQLKMTRKMPNGSEAPVVFDARLRFGDQAFNQNYDAFERFKVVGEAEKLAVLARINRRLAAISSAVAYNWNGHLDLRREIGKAFGMGVAESAMFDALPGRDDVYVRGVSRKTRTEIIQRHTNLYKLVPGGKEWMKISYHHLHMSGVFLDNAWKILKDQKDTDFVTQLDPEIFLARKEQVEVGIRHIMKLVGPTGNQNGQTSVRGSLSGEELVVDVKGFYENPPEDLKALLPLQSYFAGHKDLAPLKNHPVYKNWRINERSDVVTVKINDVDVEFRNYLYDRATGWSTAPNAYGRLFPKVKNPEGVANAMRVLNETRGARMISTNITAFIR